MPDSGIGHFETGRIQGLARAPAQAEIAAL
jgi:hypothetical protein